MTEYEEFLQSAGADTLAIRAGQQRTPEGEHSEPIFTSSSYVFESAAEAAERFVGEADGNVYSRYTNPTVRTFEQRMAALESTEQAVGTASGMAAILATCMSFLKAGDHMICSNAVFGSTIMLLNKFVAKFGVDISYVSPTALADWRAAMRPHTRLLLLETPSNPLNEIADVRALADLAHQGDALLAVDNTFCTPILQRPMELGADLVLYSATKFLDGQGRCLGGVVCGREDEMEQVLGFVRSAGPSLAPFNAWVLLKGLETLGLRMRAHCDNAARLAEWLLKHPQVEHTHFSGLPTHPGHDLATRQQSGYGSVLSFELKVPAGRQPREAAWRFIDQTVLLSHTANLGDLKSTIVHPASTTHGRLSDEERARSGIKDKLVRVSVGLENIEDIQRDLQRGFDALA